ncbi:N-acetylmuramoyl-L-alanine amidase [Kiloniella sp.]|uniref:N-acetylmuramoyl-L-alanine amidase n=1 Tax=Kiloniella sp. TaxID=1938587 RepID=UPI003B02E5B3
MQINHKFQSPNFGPRPDDVQIDMLLLHYTGMKTGQEALERLCDPAAQVSAHYLIEEDGRIFQMVAEENRAWHAGLGSWQGQGDINSCSIGIEIVNPGHEWGYRSFPEQQMRAVINLCKDILARNKIPAHRVLAHSDVAPERKEDPGELFDWKQLAKEAIGIYPKDTLRDSPCDAPCDDPGRDLRENAVNEGNFLQKLENFGYQIDHTTPHAPLTIAAIIAFQRHFRPDKLDGVIDNECCLILSKLHSQLDAHNNPT